MVSELAATATLGLWSSRTLTSSRRASKGASRSLTARREPRGAETSAGTSRACRPPSCAGV